MTQNIPKTFSPLVTSTIQAGSFHGAAADRDFIRQSASAIVRGMGNSYSFAWPTLAQDFNINARIAPIAVVTSPNTWFPFQWGRFGGGGTLLDFEFPWKVATSHDGVMANIQCVTEFDMLRLQFRFRISTFQTFVSTQYSEPSGDMMPFFGSTLVDYKFYRFFNFGEPKQVGGPTWLREPTLPADQMFLMRPEVKITHAGVGSIYNPGGSFQISMTSMLIVDVSSIEDLQG